MFNRLAIASALIAGASFSAHASDATATDGLYSAEGLVGADVYLAQENEDIGDVEDLLFGDNMALQAIVVEIDEPGFSLGDTGYVIEQGDFTVETRANSDIDNIEYRVVLDMDRDTLQSQPGWDNDWWQNARDRAARAWEQTSENAQSAWQETRQATSNLLQQAGNALEN